LLNNTPATEGIPYQYSPYLQWLSTTDNSGSTVVGFRSYSAPFSGSGRNRFIFEATSDGTNWFQAYNVSAAGGSNSSVTFQGDVNVNGVFIASNSILSDSVTFSGGGATTIAKSIPDGYSAWTFGISNLSNPGNPFLTEHAIVAGGRQGMTLNVQIGTSEGGAPANNYRVYIYYSK